jgi:tRNA (pseudouridine54-N1)-methyltransferase
VDVRRFLVVGHRAVTAPTFSLDDLAGAAGRMDILLSAANAALLLAHDLRRDAEAALLLLGPPDPPRLVRILGHRVRSYQPDLRSNAALLRKSLEHGSRVEREVSPGILASKASFEEALDRLGPTYVLLKEGGKDVRAAALPADATFVLSDNQDLTAEEEHAVRTRDALVVGLGPHALHTDQAITLVQNELDRRGI